MTVRDAAVQPTEGAHLRVPRAVVPGELVAEDQRRSIPALLIKQLDAVDGCARHQSSRRCNSSTVPELSARNRVMTLKLAPMPIKPAITPSSGAAMPPN